MKKTAITLFALAGIVMGETPITLIPTFSGAVQLPKIDATYTGWDQDIGGKNNTVTSAVMTNNLTNNIGQPMLSTGWYWNAANLNNPGEDFDFTTDADNNKDGFSFIGRQGYNGEFVVATRKLSDIITQPDSVLTSITLSFYATGQSDISFSAWVWDGSTATELIGDTRNLHVGDNVKNEFVVDDISLTKDQTLLFIWNESSAGQTNKITALRSSYTTATIPEPTTATLSLLALAGLAARRRRR